MNLALLIPLALGALGILQGTLNKEVSNTIGVAQTTFISSIATLLFCIPLYYTVKFYPQYFPEFFHVKAPFTTYKWWYIFPGLFGVFIVAGLPLAFSKLGAVKVTVGLIAAQMIASVLWDTFIDKLPMAWPKLLGMGFAVLSVVFITMSKV